MTTYTSYDLIEFGKPLQRRERAMPTPTGTQVLLRVRRAGVCHSDLHIGEGFFDLGEEGRLNMADRGIKLPVAMGHEVVGDIMETGPDATGVTIGETMLVFPWIGCGDCQACLEARENDCANMRAIGLVRDGGYATHILVPHPKFLVDIEGLDLNSAAPYACSGLTVYNALTTLGQVRGDEWIAVMGTGGLGLNAIAIARAMGHKHIIGIDHDASKLGAAGLVGANAVLDSSKTNALTELRQVTGNKLLGVLDTVGRPETSGLAVRGLAKTGRYVTVGLHGGDFKMPLPWLPQKALTICGCYVGNTTQLRELIALVKTGQVKDIPVTVRPLDDVVQALDELKAGCVTGRIVLSAD